MERFSTLSLACCSVRRGGGDGAFPVVPTLLRELLLSESEGMMDRTL